MSTNNEGTPTPLTKLRFHRCGSEIGELKEHSYVDPDFARKLERDLTATKQRLEVCEKAIANSLGMIDNVWTNTMVTPSTRRMAIDEALKALRTALHPTRAQGGKQ